MNNLALKLSPAVMLKAVVAMLFLSVPGMAQTATVSAHSLASAWTTTNGSLTLPNSTGSGIFTIPTNAGVDGMLVITIAGEVGVEPTTITWGNQSMTKATSRRTGTGNTAGYSGIWYLANPQASSNTLSISGFEGTRFSAYAIYATGVNAVPEFSATGGNNNGSATIETDTPASISPSASSLVVTSYGGSPSGVGTELVTSRIVRASDNSEPSQTTPPRAANIGSVAASGHMIASDGTPIKGRTTVTNTGGSRAITLVSFAPAGAALFNNLLVDAPSTALAGESFLVNVTARDANNATVNNSTATVTLFSASPLMEFSWDGDEVYGDNSGTLVNGVKTIRARNRRAETTSISASGGGGTPQPDSVITTAGPFTQLQILAPGETAAPGTATGKAGAPSIRRQTEFFNVTVNAVDQFWNLVNTVSDTVRITSTDVLASLPEDEALNGGTRTAAVALNTPAGSFSMTATNLTDGTKSPSTTPILPMETIFTWFGDGNANLWNTTSVNWLDLNNSPVAYLDGVSAIFNEDSINRNVNLTGTLLPASITVSNTSGDYIFSSTSGGSISGNTGLSKSGLGSLTLSTANSYTGSTTLTGGTLSASIIADSNSSSIGFGSLTIGGSTFSYTGADAATTARAITLQSSSTMDVLNGNLTLSGSITSAAGRVLTKTGSGTLILSGAADNGFLILNATAGEVQLGKTVGTVRAVAGISGIASGATVKLIGPGGDQIFGGAAANQGVNGLVTGGTLHLNGFSESLSFLNGTGGVVEGGSGTPTLTVGQADTSSTFGGAIQNSAGTLSLNKVGTGKLTLTGANTYNGSTMISAGSLALVGGSHASAITLAAGASIDFTLGSPTTSSAPVNLAAGTVLITGAVNNTTDYMLMTAASFTGPFNLPAVIPGYQLVTRASGTQLWLARDADPFTIWAGSEVNFEDDANNDGVDNGLAWLLGAANKDVNALSLLPGVTQANGDLKFTFRMQPSSARGASLLFLEFGSDLIGWSPGTLVPDVSGSNAPVTFVVVDTDVANPNNTLNVEATISSSVAAGGKLFSRLRAVK